MRMKLTLTVILSLITAAPQLIAMRKTKNQKERIEKENKEWEELFNQLKDLKEQIEKENLRQRK